MSTPDLAERLRAMAGVLARMGDADMCADICREAADEIERLRGELADRKVIERAKGLLMRAHGLPEDVAYQALRRQSMQSNTKLADVARAVVTAHETFASAGVLETAATVVQGADWSRAGARVIPDSDGGL